MHTHFPMGHAHVLPKKGRGGMCLKSPSFFPFFRGLKRIESIQIPAQTSILKSIIASFIQMLEVSGSHLGFLHHKYNNTFQPLFFDELSPCSVNICIPIRSSYHDVCMCFCSLCTST